ncbi:MAG: helix-hairpin-helix domain-containing protein [Solirubrobacterales bacterium]|jgi:competence protein ComEA|nr:helix-hairpin-helix domain-containing protein [Solirubrobacterales bacterium]
MPRINGQLVVYLVIGAVLILVGFNSIRGEQSESAVFDSEAGATKGAGAGDGFVVSAASRKLTVDVSGAVRKPGVYRFDQGERVIDAIARAGGATRSAMVGSINRAATLTDGQQVVVPSRESAVQVGAATTSGAGTAPVSLGTATTEQLEEIDGIGPVTAAKIVEFRNSQGGLSSIDELDQISGIGPVTMESLRAALAP